MIILGLNAFHADSAACLVRDGALVAAAEEERFRRIKHWAGFPTEAIRYCLQEAGVGIGEVDHVAINQDSRANQLQKLTYVVAGRPDLGLVLGRLKNRRARAAIPDLLGAMFPGAPLRAQFHAIEHHLAHLSSACSTSRRSKRRVVVLGRRMASATSPARRGGSDAAIRCQSTDGSSSRIRSACSTRR